MRHFHPHYCPSGSRRHPVLHIIGRIGITVLVTLFLIVFALYGVMYTLAKGPSPTARDLFVCSVKETSAMGFLANLFFTDEEIAQIMNNQGDITYDDTDSSLIVIPPSTPVDPEDPQKPTADAWGLVDEDGDGIILDTIRGEGYSGYMMVVLDPSRVIMASKVEDFGVRGYTVEEMVAAFDGVAGINAGGFYDPGGNGDGSIPDTMVVSGGNVYYASSGIRQGFVGFDKNNILHVGAFNANSVKEKEIQSGVCFGPVLVSNGVPKEQTNSGLNPRTAIGQRSDGAILMLVIEGRSVSSLGATYQDLVDIFLSYGAVNACNLDGGSSSMMWYNGGYVNKCASVIGIRPIPTAFVVLKKEAVSNA